MFIILFFKDDFGFADEPAESSTSTTAAVSQKRGAFDNFEAFGSTSGPTKDENSTPGFEPDSFNNDEFGSFDNDEAVRTSVF